MARRQRKKRGWLRTVLFYLLFPIAVWVSAFFIWFYWPDLVRIFSKPGEKPTPSVKSETTVERAKTGDASKPEEPVINRSEEKLADEERRKLEAILKRLQERKAGGEGS